ncbi:phage tail tube protein [Vagococcus elongatus]|uniref:Capsid protein n=1 Tax=Vagococcus elongatus TaxID=180344 RepID=A0A430AU32_9ENTE|nr:hypothetical protein [Vagococcus elongatus]RSU11568.1 hypothetical protein CBF29_07760 [Vagococcus elongatus]
MNEELLKFFLAEATKFKVGKDKEELFDLGGGVVNITPTFEEETEDVTYYIGGKETYVTGLNYQIDIEGHRLYSDETQNFVREKLVKVSDRDCYLEITEPDGRILSGPATVLNIVPFGGEAGQRQQFNFSIKFKGTPTDTPKETTP